jgi:hypothetical protein
MFSGFRIFVICNFLFSFETFFMFEEDPFLIDFELYCHLSIIEKMAV